MQVNVLEEQGMETLLMCWKKNQTIIKTKVENMGELKDFIGLEIKAMNVDNPVMNEKKSKVQAR